MGRKPDPRQQKDEFELRINEAITAPQVRLVGDNIPEQGRCNIQISFDNGRTVCMDAYVSTFSGDYMTLNVDDYDSRTSYTLRFVRTGGYDW